MSAAAWWEPRWSGKDPRRDLECRSNDARLLTIGSALAYCWRHGPAALVSSLEERAGMGFECEVDIDYPETEGAGVRVRYGGGEAVLPEADFDALAADFLLRVIEGLTANGLADERAEELYPRLVALRGRGERAGAPPPPRGAP